MEVVFIVGATASGKSKLAFDLSKKMNDAKLGPVAIVNCDSIQVYQDLNIGSAKPSIEERKNTPHFLFDYIPSGQTLTAGSYSRDFFELMEKIKNQFAFAFVVGGTGFYFQAIEKGMYSVGQSDPLVLSQVESELKLDAKKVYAELKEKDPMAAERISVNDHYRIARAIEMMRTSGKTVSEIKKEFEVNQRPFPYPLRKIGVESSREDLLPRVQKRTERMFREGLLEEVEILLKRGFEKWSPLSSVGYKESVDFLLKRSSAHSLSELSDLVITSTLQLAKKQRTWFKRDKEIQWISRDALLDQLL